jgi:hypothetical protein
MPVALAHFQDARTAIFRQGYYGCGHAREVMPLGPSTSASTYRFRHRRPPQMPGLLFSLIRMSQFLDQEKRRRRTKILREAAACDRQASRGALVPSCARVR